MFPTHTILETLYFKAGIVSLYTTDHHALADDEISFISALVANGDTALKKAPLLERIAKNTSLFLELSSVINSSLDNKDVLRNISEKTCKILDMKGEPSGGRYIASFLKLFPNRRITHA
jgi:hypothetical protein